MQGLMKVRRLRSALANSIGTPGQAGHVSATSFNVIAYLASCFFSGRPYRSDGESTSEGSALVPCDGWASAD